MNGVTITHSKGTSGRVLAFDFGERRIGVAVGNTITRTAEPQRTIVCKIGTDWDAIERTIKEWDPEQLVIGVPYNVDGSDSEMTSRARRFGRRLHGRYGLPVVEIDERHSSLAATNLLISQRRDGTRRRRLQKEDIDAWAAREILISYLTQPRLEETS
ncbi:MAG: Holliday junction resolvase RuvX [Gammaproteobacteria bacterium]|nr:Holliday junction resolvase RuvX [Gammaproteobacteria bacterium]